jgi:ABC-type dipeptide/oligopeptide/nickel transport system permease subunit
MAKRKKKLPINVVTVSAAVMVVAFFLPWVKFGGSYSGFEIPDLPSSLGKATSFKSWRGEFDINVYLVYALFLVPIAAAAVLILNFNGKDGNKLAWFPAVAPIAGFLFGLVRAGMDIFSYIVVGGWVTIAAALVMLLALLNVLKLPIPNK